MPQLSDVQARLACYAQALSTLNSSQSHELRSQLGAVTLHLDLAREYMTRDSATDAAAAERVRTEVERAAEGLKKVHAALEGFLAQTRLAATERERLDLRTLLSELERTASAAVRVGRLEWQLQMPAREVAVDGDREMLRQAMVIALVETLRTMEPGGRLDVRLDGADDVIRVTIAGGKSRAAADGQDGLGVVRAALEEHGGELRLDGGDLVLTLPSWHAVI